MCIHIYRIASLLLLQLNFNDAAGTLFDSKVYIVKSVLGYLRWCSARREPSIMNPSTVLREGLLGMIVILLVAILFPPPVTHVHTSTAIPVLATESARQPSRIHAAWEMYSWIRVASKPRMTRSIDLVGYPDTKLQIPAVLPHGFFRSNEIDKQDPLTFERSSLNGYTPHSPIVIESDIDFFNQGWPGAGTPTDPYRIENLTIDGNTMNTCIDIRNVRAHFAIRNCLLYGASYYRLGIYMGNVTNGHITDNEGTNNHIGIRLVHCSFNTLFDNVFSNNNLHGIYLSESAYNNVTGNIANNNGDHGLYLSDSGSNTISDNTFTTNQKNGIEVDSSDSNTVTHNVCNGNAYGIHLTDSSSNTIANNTCSSNNAQGIFLNHSGSNSLVNNTCVSNNAGIWLYDSSLNTLSNNSCSSNNNYGIGFGSKGGSNSIQWNVLIDNGGNTYDDGMGNAFSYNYFSDYQGTDLNQDGIGDTPHSVLGEAGNSDLHPLMLPPGSPPDWIEIPKDQTVEYGSDFRYDLNATACPPGLDRWWLSSTAHFVVDEWGVVSNATILELGFYEVEVNVNDTEGQVLTSDFTITVLETTPPTWVDLPTNQIVEFGESFQYDLNATDMSGLDDWWLDDTDYFQISNDGVVTSKTVLFVSVFDVQVWVSDVWGNNATAIFTVTVQDTTAPDWTIPPTNQTIWAEEALDYQLHASDLSGIIHWTVNDTVRFTISETGLLTNHATVSPGRYGLEITAYDPYGNELSATIVVLVKEATTTPTTPTTTTTITTTATSGIDIEALTTKLGIMSSIAGITSAIIGLMIRKEIITEEGDRATVILGGVIFIVAVCSYVWFIL